MLGLSNYTGGCIAGVLGCDGTSPISLHHLAYALVAALILSSAARHLLLSIPFLILRFIGWFLLDCINRFALRTVLFVSGAALFFWEGVHGLLEFGTTAIFDPNHRLVPIFCGLLLVLLSMLLGVRDRT